ncbi:ovomucoid-like [Mesocricetus auratus]|uniref:Ovomucoid-like n=1 Tax=Mesocricetus auratus TaxID=10036 RepID=A0A1U8BL50_MESAU|nr:ovomucoid-like [Mesocricetus auratus]
MLVFSRVMYITLLFLLYSVCSMYNRLGICSREYFPVCGTNRRTYINKCFFCIAYRESRGLVDLAHYDARSKVKYDEKCKAAEWPT